MEEPRIVRGTLRKCVSKREYDPEKRRMKRMEVYSTGAAAGTGLAGSGAAISAYRGSKKLRAEVSGVRTNAQDLRSALRNAAKKPQGNEIATTARTRPVFNSAKGTLNSLGRLKSKAGGVSQLRRAGKLGVLAAGLGGATVYLERQRTGMGRPYSSWMDGKKPRKPRKKIVPS